MRISRADYLATAAVILGLFNILGLVCYIAYGH